MAAARRAAKDGSVPVKARGAAGLGFGVEVWRGVEGNDERSDEEERTVFCFVSIGLAE